jgi:hypothetical protein
MKIKVKIQHDRKWQPTAIHEKRYWVTLPDGRYFPVFVSAGGAWYNYENRFMDHPSMEAAIIDQLAAEPIRKRVAEKRYRRIRAKEKTFQLPG